MQIARANGHRIAPILFRDAVEDIEHENVPGGGMTPPQNWRRKRWSFSKK
jgi:hypothetical protein